MICAWCKKVMKEGEEPASHGMCPKCVKKMEKEFEEYQKKKKEAK